MALPGGDGAIQGQNGHTLAGQLVSFGHHILCPLSQHLLPVEQEGSPQVTEMIFPRYGTDGTPHSAVAHWDIPHWGEAVLWYIAKAGAEPMGGWIHADQGGEQPV